MPVLDTMMRLQAAYNDRDLQASNQLGETLGGILEQRGQRSFQQDAIKFFAQNDVTPEKIQEFTSMYPGVNPAEVFQIAGTMAKEKKAQKMKDFVKNIGGILQSGGTLDEKTIGTAIEGSGLEPAEAMTVLQKGSEAGFHFRQAKAKPDPMKPIGARGLYNTETKEIVGAPNDKPDPPLDQAIKDMMTKVNPSTTEPYTAAEAYQAIVHPPKEEARKLLTPEEEAQQIRIAQGKKTDRLLTPEEEAQQVRIAQDKRPAPKGPTTGDFGNISRMVKNMVDPANPTANEAALVNAAAEPLGYEFKKLTGKTAGYGLPLVDKVLWGGNETSEWQLVPKQGTVSTPSSVTKKLVGTKNGKPVYDIGGGKWQIGE